MYKAKAGFYFHKSSGQVSFKSYDMTVHLLFELGKKSYWHESNGDSLYWDKYLIDGRKYIYLGF